MDQLDAECEVEVDDLMVLRGVRRLDLLLLAAEMVFDLKVVGGCRELPLGGLPLGCPPPGGSPPPVGLPPGPPLPLAALPVGLFGSTPPDPVLWLLDLEGGSPGGVLGFAPKSVHFRG